MASHSPLDWRRLGRTLGVGALVLLSVALLTRLLPIPDSPFLLGASAAVVFWLLETYRTGD